MNCTLVKQLANHCVPACLESIARDCGHSAVTQSEIVRRFPSVFPGGVISDIGQSPNLQDVVRDLGLADQIFQIPFPGIGELAALCRENEMLLMWTREAKHCVRVCGYDPSSELFTVMDPEQDKLQVYDAARLNRLAPSVIFFKKKALKL